MSALPVMPPADPKNSTVFLDWARLHAPESEDAAHDLIEAVRAGLGRAHEKPGRFLDDMKRRAAGLPATHLPWFWDTVGHRMGPSLPRRAGTAYGLARQAEEQHGLPVDEAYHRANALLYARLGALPAKEVAGHQRRLHATLDAAVAHQEFVRFLLAFAAGGGTPARDLHRRVQASAKAAGLGIAESAQALGDILVAAKGRPLPDALLDGLGPVFAEVPPPAPVRQALAELFPTSVTDGGAWLRLLAATGVDEALAEGRIVPSGGLSAWLGNFAFHYSYKRYSSGVMRQAMPDELYALVPRIAGQIRSENTPVSLHRSRFRHTLFDADLVDACLANGIAVADPGPRVGLEFWGRKARRDHRALAADPVLGPRLIGTAHAPRGPRAGAPRLPLGEGVDAALHERVTRLMDAVADGGLGAAQEAVAKLDTVLDPPAIAALKGIDTALDALDGVGPLLRTLRAGLPEELAWPALEEAVRRLGGGQEVAGVTCTWPVLTVFGRDRAIAVDHSGERATCTFALPEEAATHSVFFVGGSFLVGWADGKAYGLSARRAFWADRPEDSFVPEDPMGMVSYGGSTDGALGYQFATPDGGGRYDGVRVLRPGGREGIGDYEQQLNDGARLWSSRLFGSRLGRRDGAWRELDPATGERTDRTALPPFLAAEPPKDLFLTHDLQTLAPMPPGAPESPLGQADGVTGCRVLHWEHSGGAPVRFLLEGSDGRRAEFRVTHPGEDPWGIIRLPEGGAEAVLTDHRPMRCYAADDNSLLWEARGFPYPKWSGGGSHAPGGGPLFPPPAFWHFLTPRDAASSKALRTVTEDAVKALLAAAAGDGGEEAVRAEAARVLSGVTDPGVLDGVVRAVRTAAGILDRRRTLSSRSALIVNGAQVRPAGETADTALITALRGLVEAWIPHNAPRIAEEPATVGAIAADGEFLRGRIDDAARRVSPPARPRDWAPLLGDGIAAAAWRCVTQTTPDEDRTALSALLRTWAATPFAAPGTWRLGRASGEALRPLCDTGRAVATGMGDGRQGVAPHPGEPLGPTGGYRFVQPESAPVPEGATEVRTVTVTHDDAARLPRLLDLLAEHGPLTLTPEAVAAFVDRTGVRRAVAVQALAGLPTRPGINGTRQLLRAKPFQATLGVAQEAESLVHRLGTAGRARVLAAGLPDDPAELWTASGLVAAAGRMGDEWAAILGQRAPVDEELTAELEKELGAGSLSAALGDPQGGGVLTEDLRRVVAASKYGFLYAYPVAADGSPGDRPDYSTPYLGMASALSWVLTERPVGDPATVGARALSARLAERLDAPDFLVRLGRHRFSLDQAGIDALFGPEKYPVAAAEPPATDRAARLPLYYDQGLLLVHSAGDWEAVFLRPAGFARRGKYEAVARLCEDLGMSELATEIERIRVLRDGIAALAARSADTPVPAGGYEANPLLSVPELVNEAAEALGVGRDAAALYLQLLTLARPTDRNIRRWNGWGAARHRTVQAELAATGAVVTEKRSRAGRTAFLPGGWTHLKAPHLPLETAKLDAHLAAATEKREVEGPFTRLLPPRPLHEMFADAWARR